jgi:uncharacterized protein (TIGR03437 family)
MYCTTRGIMSYEKSSVPIRLSVCSLNSIIRAGILALTGAAVAAFAQPPACVVGQEFGQVVSAPCSIGGTIILQSEPGGKLFNSGIAAQGQSIVLEEPQNPGFSVVKSSNSVLSGPISGSVTGNLTIASINGAATIVGIKITSACGALGSATANLTVSTPAGPLVKTCPQVSSSTELPSVTVQTSFPAASSVNLNITVNVDAPTANDALALGAYSAQVSVNSVPAPPAGAPSVLLNGIVPVYGTVPIVEPVSWISIYGTNLAGSTATWNGDFPTSLAGTTVTINGAPAYLWYVSPGQINAQVPNETVVGAVNAVVNNGSASAASTAVLAQTGPSLSLFDSRYPAAVILTPDGSGAYGNGAYDLLGPAGYFSFKTRPAKVGETLELYGVGFGPTNPGVAAGQPYNGVANSAYSVSVLIGGAPATVPFSGMTSGAVYQIDVVVPNVTSGDQILDASVLGVHAQPNIYVPVQ